MLDEARIRAALPIGGLGVPLHILQSVGSTNDTAAELARQGAPHGTLVLADEQTAGRGRRGLRWFTPRGSALAMSLIVRPPRRSGIPASAWNTVGALAVAEALTGLGGEASVKWPNDVLLGGRKVCGVLAEAVWVGNEIEYLILGIGVNVRPESVPAPDEQRVPATSVEQGLGRPVDREDLLARIVGELSACAPKLASDDWRRAAESRLAYRGEWVTVEDETGAVRGKVVGLDSQGGLILENEAGESVRLGSAASTVRPAPRACGRLGG